VSASSFLVCACDVGASCAIEAAEQVGSTVAAGGGESTLLGAMLEHTRSIAMWEHGPADNLMSPNSKVSDSLKLQRPSKLLVGHTATLGRRRVPRAREDLKCMRHRCWNRRDSQRGSTVEIQNRRGGSQQRSRLEEAVLPLIPSTLSLPECWESRTRENRRRHAGC